MRCWGVRATVMIAIGCLSLVSCEDNPAFDPVPSEMTGVASGTMTLGSSGASLAESSFGSSTGHPSTSDIDASTLGDASTDADATVDTGSTGSGDDDPDIETSDLIELSELTPLWTTSHQIRWGWKYEGSPEAFLRYELVTGPTMADVIDRSEAARVWTSDDNPELAYHSVPGAPWVWPVLDTATDGLEPATQYWAQIIAVDIEGRHARSNPIGTATQRETHQELVVYDDVIPREYYPFDMQFIEDRPAQGIQHAQWSTPEFKWLNLRFGTDGLMLDGIARGLFDHTAVLEFDLALEEVDQLLEVGLWFASDVTPLGEPTENGWVHFNFPYWTAQADGNYHRIELPLRKFQWHVPTDDGSAVFMDLPHKFATEHILARVHVGTKWQPKTRVRIDGIRIRW